VIERTVAQNQPVAEAIPELAGEVTPLSGDLPPGLSVQDGRVVGTPTVAGTYVVKVEVCATSGQCTVLSLVFEVTDVNANLALTGSNALDLATGGGSLTLAGAALLFAGRRRRRLAAAKRN
jgi:LPXTG-motif cell wall-anchored protein